MKRLLLLSMAICFVPFANAQTSGGPDAYGYTWKSSAHPTGPSYSWVDITTTGTEVSGLGDDNVVGPFGLAPGFQFYWYPVSQFYIGSNGYIGFTSTNIASPFPTAIPLPGGANDWIGMHLSDLKFDGSGNNGKCYYYANNDSLVVSFVNVPYWTAASPSYSGSNTFQMVFSRIDKSITFNYQSMSAGLTPLPIDNAVGIENNTGALGLQTYIDVVPTNQTSVKYYYPTTVTYAVTDASVNWNNNPEDGGFFIKKSNSAVNLHANVKNLGNQPIGAFTITDTVYLGGSALSNGNASIGGLAPGDDSTVTFSNAFFSQFTGTYSFATNIQGVTGDLVPVNNRKVQKIVSVDVNQANYTLDYSDGSAEDAVSWVGGNGGVATYIQPPDYPVKIESSQFFIASNATVPSGFSAMIYDDNGPNGSHGTLLDSVYVQPSNVAVGAYNTVPTADTNIVINGGGVYVVWYMGGPDVVLGLDDSFPVSARSFELLGNNWGTFRSRLTREPMIGITVRNVPSKPNADFSIDYANSPTIAFADQSTKGPSQWQWDFDDNNATSTMQNPSHTYTANGNYNVCLIAINNNGSDTICKTVMINTISGIGVEELVLQNMVFYPNPNSGVGYITIPEGVGFNSIEIMDVLGKKQNVAVQIKSKAIELDLSHLAKGVYTYSLNAQYKEALQKRGKFVIE